MQSSFETVNGEGLVRQAFEKVQGDLAGLQPEELLQVNVDIPSMVSTILGVLPEVKELRPRIAKELPAFDLVAFDKLEAYALALSFAQTSYLTATLPPDDLQALSDEATKARERLLGDAKALAAHGLLDEGQLGQLRGANGYKNVAQDLQILSKVMEEAWPRIQGKLATTTDDLERAYRLSARLMRVVGLREQGPVQLATATDQRLRAFTLALRVYEETRRAVGYLRTREGDADSITPSLYAGRGRRKQSDAAADPAETPLAGGAVPGAAGSVPAAGGTGAPQAGGAGVAPAPAATGKDPFLS